MKKIIKNASRVLFSLILIFSVFGVINVLAEEAIFKITSISVKEKSDKVTVNDVSLSGGVITNDIVFTDKDDYITYDITIKNNTSDKYTIKSISDNNDSEYLSYTYDDLSDVELEGGEEKTFNLTITYIKESSDLLISDQNISLTLTYEKDGGTTGNEVIGGSDNNSGTISNNITNPKTGDNIYLYIILGLVSVSGLVITTVSKKKIAKSMMVVAVTSALIIPFGVRANDDEFEITFNNNVNDAQFNVIFDANGGVYSDGSTTKMIPYRTGEAPTDVKISHTENVDDTGKQLEDYDGYWGNNNIVGTDRGDTSKAHVVKIDGASSLIVDIYYNGESTDYDWACVWEGDHPNYDCSYDDVDKVIDGEKLGGEQSQNLSLNDNDLTEIGHKQIRVIGDSVTFGFNSDDSICGNGYGYYAVVQADVEIIQLSNIEIPTHANENITANGWASDTSSKYNKRVNPAGIKNPITVYALWDKKGARLEKNKFRDFYEQYSYNSDIKHFKPATEEQYNAVKDSLTNADIMSYSYSVVPLYMWTEDDTIYYYSSTGVVILPEDSSQLFFYNYGLEEIDVSGFDTSEVVDMSFMFSQAAKVKRLDLSNFDTSNVTNMQQLLCIKYNLEYLDISSFDTSKVTNMLGMFSSIDFDIEDKKLDLSHFDTSNVTDMRDLFDDTNGIEELDISSWDTSNVEKMDRMLAFMDDIKTIYVSDKFVVNNTNNTYNMFKDSKKLVGGAGTEYNSSHVDHEYARIDDPDHDKPGYFTLKQN